MRTFMMAAGVAACLIISACQQSSSEAQGTAPPPKKDLGRSQVFYQGQEPILKVDAATVTPGKTADSLLLKANGMAPGPAYKDAVFVPRIYPAPPPDGIYEVDVVATKTADTGGGVPTPIEVKGDWTNYPKAHLKAVRFMAKTNAVEAPLQTAAPPAG